ncbi:uncharacterized protein PG998_000017 [Apiospora kogelbergensis]|uniref:uncharacterized protein n=1 Tax=Apiospora kogelbergensis TaxID=1337665 RepID=UPI00312E8396
MSEEEVSSCFRQARILKVHIDQTIRQINSSGSGVETAPAGSRLKHFETIIRGSETLRNELLAEKSKLQQGTLALVEKQTQFEAAQLTFANEQQLGATKQQTLDSDSIKLSESLKDFELERTKLQEERDKLVQDKEALQSDRERLQQDQAELEQSQRDLQRRQTALETQQRDVDSAKELNKTESARLRGWAARLERTHEELVREGRDINNSGDRLYDGKVELWARQVAFSEEKAALAQAKTRLVEEKLAFSEQRQDAANAAVEALTNSSREQLALIKNISTDKDVELKRLRSASDRLAKDLEVVQTTAGLATSARDQVADELDTARLDLDQVHEELTSV